MARIRTLKPEILEDERTATLSDQGFRLFVAVILLADDFGNVRADARWLEGQIWWARRESPRVAAILGEIVDAELVSLYVVRGQAYCHINGWEKHQRIDNAGKPRVPPIDEADPDDSPRLAEVRGEMRLDPDHDPDQGSPTTDHDHLMSLSAARRDAGLVRSGLKLVSPSKDRGRPKSGLTDPELASAKAVLGVVAKYRGIEYQAERNGRPTEHARLIAQRLREGVSEEDLRAIAAYCGHASGKGWAEDDKMRQYLQPSTLFGPKSHEKYLDPARAWFREHDLGGNGVAR
jgi:uncharacterized phage protein (TIGR02220 family)